MEYVLLYKLYIDVVLLCYVRLNAYTNSQRRISGGHCALYIAVDMAGKLFILANTKINYLKCSLEKKQMFLLVLHNRL